MWIREQVRLARQQWLQQRKREGAPGRFQALTLPFELGVVERLLGLNLSCFDVHYLLPLDDLFYFDDFGHLFDDDSWNFDYPLADRLLFQHLADLIILHFPVKDEHGSETTGQSRLYTQRAVRDGR